jgi:hypothetical protein
MSERPRLVGYRTVTDYHQVHILQGGGPACPGWFFDRTTWCGIEDLTPSVSLLPTSQAPTCEACIEAERAAIESRDRDAAAAT